MKTVIFCVVEPCRLVDVNHSFSNPCCQKLSNISEAPAAFIIGAIVLMLQLQLRRQPSPLLFKLILQTHNINVTCMTKLARFCENRTDIFPKTDLLTNWEIINFSKKTDFHGVSLLFRRGGTNK